MNRGVLRSIAAVAIGLGIGLLLCAWAGENPWHVFKVLVKSAVGTPYDFGMTLAYTVPLIFTGISVAIAFQAGLFNIGAEGQLTVGALAVAITGLKLGHWGVFGQIAAVLAGMAAGAIWGLIPALLKAFRGSHEVINTIMLNFIAAGLTSWATLYYFKNPDSQNPETAVLAPHMLFPRLPGFDDAPVTWGAFFAIGALMFYGFILRRARLGFEIRAVGESQDAASQAGISPTKTWIWAMALAGAFAGWVGVVEVLGVTDRFRVGFSPGYGFIGIAVALLGKNRPLGILGSALLFGALQKGASDLDLETENITRDFSQILQALVILIVAWVTSIELRGKKKKT